MSRKGLRADKGPPRRRHIGTSAMKSGSGKRGWMVGLEKGYCSGYLDRFEAERLAALPRFPRRGGPCSPTVAGGRLLGPPPPPPPPPRKLVISREKWRLRSAPDAQAAADRRALSDVRFYKHWYGSRTAGALRALTRQGCFRRTEGPLVGCLSPTAARRSRRLMPGTMPS